MKQIIIILLAISVIGCSKPPKQNYTDKQIDSIKTVSFLAGVRACLYNHGYDVSCVSQTGDTLFVSDVITVMSIESCDKFLAGKQKFKTVQVWERICNDIKKINRGLNGN